MLNKNVVILLNKFFVLNLFINERRAKPVNNKLNTLTTVPLLVSPEIYMRTKLKQLQAQGIKENRKLKLIRKIEYVQAVKLTELREEFKELDRKLAMRDGRFKVVKPAVLRKSGKIGPIKTNTNRYVQAFRKSLKTMSIEEKKDIIAQLKE